MAKIKKEEKTVLSIVKLNRYLLSYVILIFGYLFTITSMGSYSVLIDVTNIKANTAMTDIRNEMIISFIVLLITSFIITKLNDVCEEKKSTKVFIITGLLITISLLVTAMSIMLSIDL